VTEAQMALLMLEQKRERERECFKVFLHAKKKEEKFFSSHSRSRFFVLGFDEK
jgi:hypothetical protein